MNEIIRWCQYYWWLIGIGSLLAGGTIGVAIMACMNVARRADDAEEKYLNNPHSAPCPLCDEVRICPLIWTAKRPRIYGVECPEHGRVWLTRKK